MDMFKVPVVEKEATEGPDVKKGKKKKKQENVNRNSADVDKDLIVAVVLAVLALILCFPFGIVSIVLLILSTVIDSSYLGHSLTCSYIGIIIGIIFWASIYFGRGRYWW